MQMRLAYKRTLGNVRTLLINSNENVARGCIEADRRMVVSDFANNVANNLGWDEDTGIYTDIFQFFDVCAFKIGSKNLTYVACYPQLQCDRQNNWGCWVMCVVTEFRKRICWKISQIYLELLLLRVKNEVFHRLRELREKDGASNNAVHNQKHKNEYVHRKNWY